MIIVKYCLNFIGNCYLVIVENLIIVNYPMIAMSLHVQMEFIV